MRAAWLVGLLQVSTHLTSTVIRVSDVSVRILASGSLETHSLVSETIETRNTDILRLARSEAHGVSPRAVFQRFVFQMIQGGVSRAA